MVCGSLAPPLSACKFRHCQRKCLLLQVVLPEGPGGNWWELCSVAHTDVLEVASEIHALYLQPPPVYVALSRAAHAPGASAPRVSSLAAAASPASVPASPQGGPPAAGGSAAAGEGSAATGQLPNGAEASAEGDATGGVGGASAGRSDSRGQAASGPENVSCLLSACCPVDIGALKVQVWQLSDDHMRRLIT